jgi:hypothetical protein
MAHIARQAPAHDIDATPWFCHGTLQWLGGMASAPVACYRIDPSRSKAAFFVLIDDCEGILGSAGDGVSQTWGAQRPTGLAHLIRRARGFAQPPCGSRRLRCPGTGRAATLVSHGPCPSHRWPVAGGVDPAVCSARSVPGSQRRGRTVGPLPAARAGRAWGLPIRARGGNHRQPG